jgi:hypothetical protein
LAVPEAARVSVTAAVRLAEGCAYPAAERFADARGTEVLNPALGDAG